MKDIGVLIWIDWIKAAAFFFLLPIFYFLATFIYARAVATRFEIPIMKPIIVTLAMLLPISYVVASLATTKIVCSRAGPPLLPERPLPSNGVRMSGNHVAGFRAGEWPREWSRSDGPPPRYAEFAPPAEHKFVTKSAQPYLEVLNIYESETTISRLDDGRVVARRLEYFTGGGLLGHYLMFVNGTPFVGCSQTHPDLQTWQPRGLVHFNFTKRNPDRVQDLLVPLRQHDDYFVLRTVERPR